MRVLAAGGREGCDGHPSMRSLEESEMRGENMNAMNETTGGGVQKEGEGQPVVATGAGAAAAAGAAPIHLL